jgi:hypothetical protein
MKFNQKKTIEKISKYFSESEITPPHKKPFYNIGNPPKITAMDKLIGITLGLALTIFLMFFAWGVVEFLISLFT